MEFMNDEYFSWDVTYFLNGWLFNRIPLLKKLKWREIVSCRGLYGHLSDKNNPDMTDGLFAFPIASTRTMGKTPYVEAGVGIENQLRHRAENTIETHGAITDGIHFTTITDQDKADIKAYDFTLRKVDAGNGAHPSHVPVYCPDSMHQLRR